MRSLYNVAPSVFLVRRPVGKFLSCKRTSPITIIGFKDRRHADYVARVVSGHPVVNIVDAGAYRYIIEKDGPEVGHVEGVKEHATGVTEVVESGLVNLCIKLAVNNVRLALVCDMEENKKRIILSCNQDDDTNVHVDLVMVKNNLDNIIAK